MALRWPFFSVTTILLRAAPPQCAFAGKPMSSFSPAGNFYLYFAGSFHGVAVNSPVTPKGWTSTLPEMVPDSSSEAV